MQRLSSDCKRAVQTFSESIPFVKGRRRQGRPLTPFDFPIADGPLSFPTADIDHSPSTRQLAEMNRRIVLIILLALIVGMAAGWAGRGLVANDRCLDRGGAWDGRSDSCSLSATNVR